MDLLTQISKYPPNTTFHLNTWTLGYEEAWVALASYFNTQIHLDEYRLRLYNSIGAKETWEHGPFLLGRAFSDIILTDDKTVRFHSSNAVGEVSGELLVEIGSIVKDVKLLELMQQAGVKPGFSLPLDASTPESDMKIEEFIEVLKKNLEAFILARQQDQVKSQNQDNLQEQNLPSWFGYPAARHSSFFELQEFVGALAPRDVYPCVAADGSWYQKDSIHKLFGKYCAGTEFAFDIERDLDRQYAQQEQDEYELAEQRATGMAEESQQAGSQHLVQSSQSQEHDVQGVTQPDDTNLRNLVPDMHTHPLAPPSTHPHAQGETQVDRFDPHDPGILAKVEKAVEEGKILSKSILGSNSQRQRGLSVHEIQFDSSARIRGSTQEDGTETIAILTSSGGEYRTFTKKGEKIKLEDNAHPQQEINKACEMDSSQDSIGDVAEDLDRDKIRYVMGAVNAGRWSDQSRQLGFNSLSWKYQMEKEL
ncbi:hypothetical protein AA313_de0208538 [Arthrobotrys entomopaga]|nr:hypothetical protein AA313_de0208538 [Arthrobotrys entomopaga]